MRLYILSKAAEISVRVEGRGADVSMSSSRAGRPCLSQQQLQRYKERERECVYVYQHLLVVLAGADEERGARRVRAHVFQYRLVVLNLRESITYLSHFLSHTLSSYVWMRSHTSSCWRGAVQTGSTSLGPKPSSGTFSPSS